MRISAPARKHGVSDADIMHALANTLRHISLDEDFTMVLGPATNTALLEVGVLYMGTVDEAVIHAMAMRPKYYRLLT